MITNLIADDLKLSPEEGFGGYGKLGTGVGEGIPLFVKFISSTIGVMTIIAIIWFAFVLVTGAIAIISAGSDKTALEAARKRITNGLIGLVVVVAAIFLISLIGRLIGIPNILDIGTLFKTIPILQ
jgi:hypothetical protein